MIGKRGDAFSGASEIEAGEDAPLSSIARRAKLVLEIVPGERRLLCEFGCRIHHLASLEGAAQRELAGALIEEALERWSPDLAVDRAEVLGSEDRRVHLRLRAAGAWHALAITHRRAVAPRGRVEA